MMRRTAKDGSQHMGCKVCDLLLPGFALTGLLSYCFSIVWQ
jgi:uncharacterized protein YcbK (DUF882 family)